MNPVSQFKCRARFLPTVRIKQVNNLKDRKRSIDKLLSSKPKPKLKITEEKGGKIGHLIDGYYKRFKDDRHHTEPFSVCINFKEVSQEQLEIEMMKERECRARANNQKNKNRSNSEGAYSIQLKKIKQQQEIRMKYCTRALLTGIPSYDHTLPFSYMTQESPQAPALPHSESPTISLKSPTQVPANSQFPPPEPASLPNQSILLTNADNSQSCNISVQQKKAYRRHQPLLQMTNNEKRQMSTICGISLKKKAKAQSKTIEALKKATIDLFPSPWRQDTRRYIDNCEDSLDLFTSSLQQP